MSLGAMALAGSMFATHLLAQAPSDSAFVRWARPRIVAVGPMVDSSPIPGVSAAARRARVIGVGESVHNVREFLLLRQRLLRQLVREAGVTSLALESGLPEARALDAWVTGQTDSVDFDAALKYGFGAFEEVRQAFRWLREWNAGPGRLRPVRVYGIDLPASAGSMLPAVDQLLQLLARVDGPEAIRVGSTFRPLAAKPAGVFWRPAAARYDSLTPEEQQALRHGAEGLSAVVGRHRAALGAEDYDWADRLARVVQQAEAMLRIGAFHPTNPRDQAMAENTLWVLGRQPRGGRVMLWAHNAHIQRVPIAGPGSPAKAPVTTIGEILARQLGGAGYFPIGTSYGGLSLDSATAAPRSGVDGALGNLGGHPPFFLDLSNPPPAVRRWLEVPRPMRFEVSHLLVPLGRAFATIVYFDAVEPAARR